MHVTCTLFRIGFGGDISGINQKQATVVVVKRTIFAHIDKKLCSGSAVMTAIGYLTVEKDERIKINSSICD